MKFTETTIQGCYLVEIEPHTDERGIFAYTWLGHDAQKERLVSHFDYSCVSSNIECGTLRGMHYQKKPHAETKLVRCTRGSIYDVVLDLRLDSPSFNKWIAEELTADNHKALYVPAGCAHGFITLEDNSEILYQISGEYIQDASTGVRFNDPVFGIKWPMDPKVISERDEKYPDFTL